MSDRGSRRAFVTGATGFLGKHLVEQLLDQGWQVTALHRRDSDRSFYGERIVTWVEGSLQDQASLAAAMPAGVERVFHVAANTSVWARDAEIQRRVNVEGTRNLLAAALIRGAGRFVHVSTWSVYDLNRPEIDEDTPQTGGSSWIGYCRTKWQAEQAVRMAADRGLDAVIVNPAHILGRYDLGNWARMFTMVQDGRLPGIPPGSGSFAPAAAVAAALLSAGDRGRRGRNYLLGGADHSFQEVIAEIGFRLGAKVPGRVLPAAALRAAGRIHALKARLTGRPPELTPEAADMVCHRTRITSTRAVDELGYRPAPLYYMLADCHAWLKSAGRLR